MRVVMFCPVGSRQGYASAARTGSPCRMDLRRASAYLPPMTLDADLLIVGGGKRPGLALSARAGRLSAIVIDALPDTMRDGQDFDGRSYALALALGADAGPAGGVAGRGTRAQPILRITVSDGRAGEGAAPQRLTLIMPRSKRARWAR